MPCTSAVPRRERSGAHDRAPVRDSVGQGTGHCENASAVAGQQRGVSSGARSVAAGSSEAGHWGRADQMIWSDTHARRWHSLTRQGSCRRRNVFLARASGIGPLPERRPHPPRLSRVWRASLDRRVVLRGDVRGGRVLRLQHVDGCSAARSAIADAEFESRTFASAAREAAAVGTAVGYRTVRSCGRPSMATESGPSRSATAPSTQRHRLSMSRP